MTLSDARMSAHVAMLCMLLLLLMSVQIHKRFKVRDHVRATTSGKDVGYQKPSNLNSVSMRSVPRTLEVRFCRTTPFHPCTSGVDVG